MEQKKQKVLLVDDEPSNISLMKGFLGRMGLETVGTENAKSALQILDESFDLVLTDVMMPGINGYEFVRMVRGRKEFFDLPIIMVTTLYDKDDRLKAAESGANDFISKPIDLTELRVRVTSLLKLKQHQDELKEFRLKLESTVRMRTKALQQALNQLKQTNYEVVFRLSAAAEFRDNETAEHIKRMSVSAANLARTAGLTNEEVDIVLHASPLHDIGKIGVPDNILLKPSKLTAEEWGVMKTHTEIGGRILEGSNNPLLKAGEIIARTHHERWDGTGYPQGLSGLDIPVYGRICAIADVFDALTNVRPYKPAFPVEKAVEIMQEGRGTHFDPDLLDLFLEEVARREPDIT